MYQKENKIFECTMHPQSLSFNAPKVSGMVASEATRPTPPSADQKNAPSGFQKRGRLECYKISIVLYLSFLFYCTEV